MKDLVESWAHKGVISDNFEFIIRCVSVTSGMYILKLEVEINFVLDFLLQQRVLLYKGSVSNGNSQELICF